VHSAHPAVRVLVTSGQAFDRNAERPTQWAPAESGGDVCPYWRRPWPACGV
jgi:hypothetical protein